MRKALERNRVGRQRMGLLVRDHLQPMLDAAEEIISRFKIAPRVISDPAALGESGERRQGAAAAQLRVAAAGDELLGLNEEFDLADAAAAELDVVAGDRNLGVATKGVDLPLHGVGV